MYIIDMNRNADYIMTKIIDPPGHAKKAQVGVDLTLAKLEKMVGYPKFIDSKLQNAEYVEADKNELGEYVLEPNKTYALEFEQGLKRLEPNEWAYIVQRSSLNRVGVQISSSIWDPGFTCERMGLTLRTGSVPVRIPIGTRVAQILIFNCEEPSELYNGRWQGLANHA